MILADTSVWADHLQIADPKLSEFLHEGRLYMHPFVIGEIALGYLRKRRDVLRSLDFLPSIHVANPEEVLLLIERQQLMGTGVGYIDAHLLASALTTPGCQLWTRDKRLGRAAASAGVLAVVDH
jgi:predicted nucleic acid-binding protein